MRMEVMITSEQSAMIKQAAKEAAAVVACRIPSEAQIERIAEAAAERAVRTTFEKFGFDPNNPRETMELLTFARSSKEFAWTIKKQALISTIAIIVGGICWAVWASIKGIK